MSIFALLQWGRDVSIPEITLTGRAPVKITKASMGPGCFYPGNGAKAWARSVDFSASMGPGCFYPGNEVTGADMLLLTLLQWGRDVSIPEIP